MTQMHTGSEGTLLPFRLDHEALSTKPPGQPGKPKKLQLLPNGWNRYYSKEELEMGKKKEPIMAKPSLVVQKRKMKSLILESVEVTPDNISAVRKWAVGSKLHGYDGSPTARYLVLAGGQIARQGDFIIKHIDGRYMAFKPQTFGAISEFVGFMAKYKDGDV